MANGDLHPNEKAEAKAIFLSERGQISDPEISKALVAAGYAKFTAPTIGNWRKKYRWAEALGPIEAPNLVSRAARGRELQTLLSARGGELSLLDDVYKEMILASAAVTEKLLAWATALEPTKMKPDDALAILKHMPPLLDRAMKLREQVNDFRWKGAAAVLTGAGTDPKALNGEIMPPEAPAEGQGGQVERTDRTDRTDDEGRNFQPALSDAISAIAKARKAAPTLVKDVAPKARQSIARG